MIYAMSIISAVLIIIAYKVGLEDGRKIEKKEPLTELNPVKIVKTIKEDKEQEKKLKEYNAEAKRESDAVEDFISRGGLPIND